MSSTRAADLAERFLTAHGAFMATLERMPEGVWRGRCPGEERTVCAVAHHIADGYGLQLLALRKIAAGESLPPLTREELDGGNAERAARASEASKAEVAALAERRAERAAGFVRGLSDEQLGLSGTYLAWVPPMTIADVVETIMIGHLEGHHASIEAAARDAVMPADDDVTTDGTDPQARRS